MKYILWGVLSIALVLSLVYLGLLAGVGVMLLGAPGASGYLLLASLLFVCLGVAYPITALLRWADDR